jgi:serine protease Do
VGETVFSIGAPFGLEHSMNSGLVSGRDRLVIPEAGTGMLQTEVAVNPGGSGSPLFSLRGEVVGMNTLIFSYSGGYNGVTLAIPAEVVEQTVARLKSGQPRSTYRIGARFRDLSPLLARSMGVASGAGAIVVSTDPTGAAAAAGLRIGDVVLELDGVGVTDALGLLAALNGRGAKPQRTLKVMRERAPRMLQLALPPRVDGERTSRAGRESFTSNAGAESIPPRAAITPCPALPAAHCGVPLQPVSTRR